MVQGLTGQVVQVITADDIKLSGIFVKGKKNKPAVIHIHGFEGDFFTNTFVHKIAEKLNDNGISFLPVQTRGMANDYTLDTSKYGAGKRIGAHLERLEEAYLDIDAWVKYLVDQGYTDIILQGHSLGTFKIVRYLFEGKYANLIKKLILLCPFDKTAGIYQFIQDKWKENIKIAEQKVKVGEGTQIIPKGWDEIELSYQSYLSWYQDNDLSRIFDYYDKNNKLPVLNKIKISVKVIVGTKDEFFHMSDPEHKEEAMATLKKNIKNFTGVFIKNSQHGFVGFEDIVASEVLNFI